MMTTNSQQQTNARTHTEKAWNRKEKFCPSQSYCRGEVPLECLMKRTSKQNETTYICTNEPLSYNTSLLFLNLIEKKGVNLIFFIIPFLLFLTKNIFYFLFFHLF